MRPIIRYWIVLLCLLPVWIITAQGDDLSGVIDDETPFRAIPLTIESDGTETLIVEMQATAGDLDPLLYLLDAAGNVLAQNDDIARGIRDSRLVYSAIPAGEYTIIATRFGVDDGDTSGDFFLEIQREPLADETPPYRVAPDDLIEAGFPAMEPQPTAQWTILAYYGADTNLEPAILSDINEFELAGGSDETVRILALVDRTPGYTDTDDDWETLRLYEIQADLSGDDGDVYPPTLDSQPLAELDERDTGYGETLAQFLVWGMRHYPAEQYAVAFASHGAGWRGIIVDDTANHSILDLPELNEAFNVARQAVGIDKFDFLINDACLMSSIEYYDMAAEFFRLSIASPEIVVNPALDMTLFTELLRAQTALPQVSESLIRQYMEVDIFQTSGSDAEFLSQALTDLEAFAPVRDALNAFTAIFNAQPERHINAVGQARANTYTYSGFIGDENKIDLGDFMRQVMTNSNDQALQDAAQAVIEALAVVRLQAEGGPRVADRISYYNIYFPADSADFDVRYLEQTALTSWGDFLRTYYNTLLPRPWEYADLDDVEILDATSLGFHTAVPPRVRLLSVYPPVASILTPVNIQMEIIGRDLARGQFVADFIREDGSRVRYQTAPIYAEVVIAGQVWGLNEWESGVETSTFIWDGYLPTISDGQTTTVEMVTETDTTAALEGRYRIAETDDWSDVSVVFDLRTGLVTSVVSRSAATGARAVITIPPGATFQTYQSIVTPDGRTIRQPGTVYTWGDLVYESAPAPSGRYALGIRVETFGGVAGIDTIEVEIDNSDVTDGLAGYLDIDYGFRVVLPDDFDELGFDEDNGWFQSFGEDSDIAVTIYEAETAGTLAETLDELTFWQGLTLTGEPRPITAFGGQDALAFEYTLGEFSGRGFIAQQGLFFDALAFTVDATGENPRVDEIYDRLLATAEPVEVADNRDWFFAELEDDTSGRFASYPIRQDWLDDADDMWDYHIDPAEPMTFAAAAIINKDDGDLLPTAGIFDLLLNERIQPSRTDFTITDRRDYFGAYLVWEAIQYTAQVDGRDVIGRLYAVGVETTGYAMWFETPLDAEPARTFREVFEPMVDGFQPDVDNPFAIINQMTGAEPTENVFTSGDLRFTVPLDFTIVENFPDQLTAINEETEAEIRVDVITDGLTVAEFTETFFDEGNATIDDRQPVTQFDLTDGEMVRYNFGAGWYGRMLYGQRGDAVIIISLEGFDPPSDAEWDDLLARIELITEE